MRFKLYLINNENKASILLHGFTAQNYVTSSEYQLNTLALFSY